MNQLACIYCPTKEELVTLLQKDTFIEKANSYRSCVFLPEENTDFISRLLSEPKNTALLGLMEMFSAHECIAPFLISENISGHAELGSRVPALDSTQKYWVQDVDLWFDFPDNLLETLTSLAPQAYFLSLSVGMYV